MPFLECCDERGVARKIGKHSEARFDCSPRRRGSSPAERRTRGEFVARLPSAQGCFGDSGPWSSADPSRRPSGSSECGSFPDRPRGAAACLHRSTLAWRARGTRARGPAAGGEARALPGSHGRSTGPDFVFLIPFDASPSLVNSTSRSCSGDRMLNSPPAASKICLTSAFHPLGEFSRDLAEDLFVERDSAGFDRRQALDQRMLERRVEFRLLALRQRAPQRRNESHDLGERKLQIPAAPARIGDTLRREIVTLRQRAHARLSKGRRDTTRRRDRSPSRPIATVWSRASALRSKPLKELPPFDRPREGVTNSALARDDRSITCAGEPENRSARGVAGEHACHLPAHELPPIAGRFTNDRRRCFHRNGWRCRRRSGSLRRHFRPTREKPTDARGEALHLQLFGKAQQLRRMQRTYGEIGELDRQIEVGVDGRQSLRQSPRPPHTPRPSA